MSLPAASKAVSADPPKNSVVSPTDKALQDADIDRKLRLYGAIQALRNGRLPDNAQIDDTLVYVRDHSPVDTNKLSAEGRKLIQDVRNILETTRSWVKQKNADEIVQQFFYHTSGAEYRNKPAVDVPVTEKEARKDAEEALEHLRTLFHLLVTNSELRKLLTDFELVGRGLFADTAASIADRVRPPPEAMVQVDEATPTHQFDDSSNQPGPSSAEVKDKTSPTIDAPKTTENGTNSTDVPKESDAEAVAAKEGSTEPPAKKTLKSRFQNLTGRVPAKHKQFATTEFESGRKYMKEQFPKERLDQFVYRLKKVVVECQSNTSYQSSLSWFLSQLENYFGHGKHLASAGAGSTTSFFADPNLKQATAEMRTFLERCANGKSLDGIFNAAKALWEDAQRDEELRNWWGRVDTFVRKSLLEPGFILAPMFESQARQLRDESRQFFDVKYKGRVDEFVHAVQAWFGAWAADPLNNRLTNDWTALLKELLFNEEGHLTYKPHLWHDIHAVILPELIEKVGYVPIPRIEYTDDDYDLVIENLMLQGRNLFPKVLEFKAINYVKFSPYKNIKDEHEHTLELTMSQIQADMRDVAFYYRKKGGLKIHDSGLADVFLGGKGITIKVKITSNAKDRQHGRNLFKVKTVKVKVDRLKFAVHDSHHNLLYKTLRPLATGLIKRQISKAIADGIRSGLEYADLQLVDVRDRMAAAHDAEGGSRRQVLKEIVSSKSKGKGSDTSSVSSVEQHKRHSSFRIVPTRDSMLLPEQGHDKGWIRRQAERDALAQEGEGWHSKAFSIVDTAA